MPPRQFQLQQDAGRVPEAPVRDTCPASCLHVPEPSERLRPAWRLALECAHGHRHHGMQAELQRRPQLHVLRDPAREWRVLDARGLQAPALPARGLLHTLHEAGEQAEAAACPGPRPRADAGAGAGGRDLAAADDHHHGHGRRRPRADDGPAADREPGLPPAGQGAREERRAAVGREDGHRARGGRWRGGRGRGGGALPRLRLGGGHGHDAARHLCRLFEREAEVLRDLPPDLAPVGGVGCRGQRGHHRRRRHQRCHGQQR
mmetsp:Transcript_50633/g.156721  ORF Transcript_50633/g.156721 Transcript_50633/m.156721 type:complete len:261 (-) Transcript_50633:448-1230(-)